MHTHLVAGIYRIIDQIHTSTNSVGDLVASVCISQMEGELDHEIFNQEEAKKASLSFRKRHPGFV
ncbi:MAG: hypothetical protein ACLTR6_10800 [Clostridium fessum]